MKPNKLRRLLREDKPTIGTRIVSSWPTIVEVVGHTGIFDYVEFSAEYAPFDLYDLDNLCRAAELYDLGTMIKVDQEPRLFLPQRAIGAGFQSVLFADCRSADDVRYCVKAVRPETPEAGGVHGSAMRRWALMGYGGGPAYVEALQDIVVAIMIEKKGTVDELDEILAIPGVDMLQWGPSDYSLSIGRPGAGRDPDIRAIERRIIESCQKAGVAPRAEINTPDQAKYYLDLGVRHFNLSIDIRILFEWLSSNGETLRKAVEGA